MIIVSIKGGLGNQLFQYAIGLQLSKNNNCKLYLDLSWYKNNTTDTPRKFMLDYFNLEYEIATEHEIGKIKGLNSILGKIKNRLENYFLPIEKRKHIVELNHCFNEKILSLKGDVYLEGTWMNEKYFLNVADQIKKMYSKKPILHEYYKEIEGNIRDKNAFCVHIRRGDYVSNPSTLKYHGLVPFEYYLNSMSLILKSNNDAEFYFFSDDIDWVKSCISDKSNCTFVSKDFHDSDIQEFYLMSLCKGQIIANSTFSWWAAWLNTHPEKVVYAPKRWSKHILNSQDIIPISWEIVD
jgi:hypothetical protein